ncbi:hypothetical protein [Calycomorphotria hydatis]|uniref:Uncharacterized protein n=1 Tax=Calycomorphotria hydatis TaxID=2528027 RepID=A0A517T9F8_9PLAN|nr:hypothetical protein [Calycomorphotria hydatis]QDT65011.1 hypothetical protein V22_22570 [Calycomorphotria hydatis]
MHKLILDRRWLYAGLGIVAGIAIANFWPQDNLQAQMTSRSEKFEMFTLQMDSLGSAQGVFVLDFLTGRLTGAALNSATGVFTQQYARDVMQDFNVDPASTPRFAVLSGITNLPAKTRVTPAVGSIYIGELTSGQVICYAVPYRVQNRPTGLQTIQPIATFQFRESL